MKNIISWIFSIMFSILQFSCHKTENQNDLDRDFANQFQFRNCETLSDFYFKGVLDNQRINYSDGVDNYYYQQEIISTSILNGNSFSTIDTSANNTIFSRAFAFELPIADARNKPNSWLEISLSGPSSKNIHKADSLLRYYLENKRDIFFNSHQIFKDQNATSNDSLGFSLNLNMLKYINDFSGESHFSIVTKQGNQEGSYLKIKEVKKITGLDNDNYKVKFSLYCKLYFDFDYSSPFKTLSEGEMSIQIILPH